MLLATLVALVLASSLAAQAPPPNGPRSVDPGWYALTNAQVVTAPGKPPTPLVVVCRDGRITAVGGKVPSGATEIDCRGLVLYPGFIEAWLPIDVPALDAKTGDQHWNSMLQANRHALEGAGVPTADREALRALGFTTAAITPSGGILKGTAAVVQLDEPSAAATARVLRRNSYVAASLQRNRGGYPNSEMGAIALLRQTLLDAQHLQRCAAAVAADPSLAPLVPPATATLQAVADHWSLPLFCDSQDELGALRLLSIAKEFERRAVLVGSGMEFRRLAALAASKAAILVPLAFPDAPDTSSAAAAEQATLRQLQSWEQAPGNSKRLLDAGVELAWTTARQRDRKDFAARLHEAIAFGIDEAQALAALTTIPARMLGIADQAGTIETGKWANFVAVAGSPFQPAGEIRAVFVGGRRFELQPAPQQDLDGEFRLPGLAWPTADSEELLLRIAAAKVHARLGEQELTVDQLRRDGAVLECRLLDKKNPDSGPLWLRLQRDGEAVRGLARNSSGVARECRLAPAPPSTTKEDPQQTSSPSAATALAPLPLPLGGHGRLELPAARDFALVGAELWTCDGRGVLRDGAVLVRGGRIAYAGPREGLPALPPEVQRIDVAGKHLTPGLIDCHSHTGISRGINESGQAVTAEVRIADVIDPDDINWYRQLAGGVTAVNQLHGSANAIGGQSSTVKLRWGVQHPEQMRFAGAVPGIKFALGENPRRANSGDSNTRYPNTRMGVDALLRDRFAAAEAYRREHAAYERLSPAERARSLPPRRDLELDAVAEVIQGKRWIHCHSYRQDEIFMLCELVQEYGIKIGTLQHVLEGYKVADVIAQNAVGASSFSDWWGYKFEVYDAIPDNGAILHEAGVVVSFNSDSNEHARRLNTEAGKAVKYGNVNPAEALCFVTKNPAIQLGIYERTGSLTVGKDADLALWSGNPLSYRSRCEATWVDGRLQFSLAEDQEFRAGIQRERERLLAKAATAKRRATRPGPDPKDAYWAAEDLTAKYCCREHDGGR